MNCGPDLHREPTAGGISKPDREARADHTLYLSSCTGIRLCLLKMWKNNRALVDICGTSHISLMKSSSTVTSIHHFVCKWTHYQSSVLLIKTWVWHLILYKENNTLFHDWCKNLPLPMNWKDLKRHMHKYNKWVNVISTYKKIHVFYR